MKLSLKLFNFKVVPVFGTTCAQTKYEIASDKVRNVNRKLEGKMSAFKKWLRQNQKGVTTVEYAVMIVLVALAIMAGGSKLSTAVLGTFDKAATQLTK
jgi:Flp pilus assembly pilin Flp